MIEIKNLSAQLGDFSLNDINLTILDREYFVLLGPTGAGKTILVECIAGLYRFRKGKLWIDENDVTPLPPEERQIGYVPQDYCLFPFLNVLNNIHVTHNLREAGELADRIAVLNMGKLEQVGTPQEVFFYPQSETVADFLGTTGFPRDISDLRCNRRLEERP